MSTTPFAERKYALPIVALAALGLLATAGCSGGRRSPVAGKVTYQGKAVTGGSLTFAPQGEGKPATAKIQSDGKFNAGTEEEGDGLKAGTYKVTYSAPTLDPGRELKPGESPPRSPFHGLVPKQETVEIKPEANNLEIELVRPGR
jgi:hypothetical protein